MFLKIRDKFRAIAESKSGSFLFICVAFILGVGAASIFIKNQVFSFLVFCFAVVLAVFVVWFWKDLKKRLLILLILFFVLGILRFVSFLPANKSDELKFYNGNTVFLKGIVAGEYDSRGMSARFVFKTSEVGGEKVSGLAQIKVLKYPEYHYGDILEITCKLKNPLENYANYLAGKNIYSVCDYPESVKVLGRAGNSVLSVIFSIKKKFSETIFKIFPEPHASFLAGILYGGDEGLSDEISGSFRAAGVSHIVAVSGYNISIVAEFIFWIFAFVFFFIPKKFTFWIAFGAIFVFSVISGAEASVVRAGLMYFAVMFAKEIGRPSRRGNVLVLVAAVMTAQNPKILVFDIGFQLSFMAIIGLFYLSPILEKKLHKLMDVWEIKKMLIETFSAIILTAPLLLYHFGNFSFVAPIANLLVLFFIPSAMLFGFLSGIFGIVFLPLGKIFGLFAWAILNYIISAVEFISKIPFASVEFGHAPIVFVLALYCLIFYFAFWKKESVEETSLIETDGFIIEES